MNRIRETLLVLVPLAPLAAQTLEQMTAGIVPVVVHEPGANDSLWRTDLHLRQTDGAGAARVTLHVLDPNGDGWQRELDYFINCVSAGKPVERCLPDSSRVSIALALLERRAVQTGRAVVVSPSVSRRGFNQTAP